MDRLTEKQSAGYDLKAMNGEWCDNYCHHQRIETCRGCGIYEAIQKLAYYEDLEEKGRLIIFDSTENEIKKLNKACSNCPHYFGFPCNPCNKKNCHIYRKLQQLGQIK